MIGLRIRSLAWWITTYSFAILLRFVVSQKRNISIYNYVYIYMCVCIYIDIHNLASCIFCQHLQPLWDECQEVAWLIINVFQSGLTYSQTLAGYGIWRCESWGHRWFQANKKNGMSGNSAMKIHQNPGCTLALLTWGVLLNTAWSLCLQFSFLIRRHQSIRFLMAPHEIKNQSTFWENLGYLIQKLLE